MQEKNETLVTFGTNLQRLMSERNLTNIALARAIGVTHVAIGNYLKGRIPTAQILMKIAGYFQVSPDELLGPSVSSLPKVQPPQGRPSSVTKSSELESLWEIAFWHSPSARAIAKRVLRASYAEAEIKITPADLENGFVDVALQYLIEDIPKDWPKRIRLTRPDFRECRRILLEVEGGGDQEAPMLACLAPEYRSDKFLNRLSPFCIHALAVASEELVLGKRLTSSPFSSPDDKQESA